VCNMTHQRMPVTLTCQQIHAGKPAVTAKATVQTSAPTGYVYTNKKQPPHPKFDAGIVYSLGVYVYIYIRRLYTRKVGMSLYIGREVFQRMSRLCG